MRQSLENDRIDRQWQQGVAFLDEQAHATMPPCGASSDADAILIGFAYAAIGHALLFRACQRASLSLFPPACAGPGPQALSCIRLLNASWCRDQHAEGMSKREGHLARRGSITSELCPRANRPKAP